MRSKLIALIALPLILIIGLVGCAGTGHTTSAKADKPIATKVAAAPTPDPTPTPVDDTYMSTDDPNDHSGALGTRGNPAPAGTPAVLNDINAKIGAVSLNATADVAQKDPSYPLRNAGDQFVLFPVTYTMATQGTPLGLYEFDFVSPDGTVHFNDVNGTGYPGSLYVDAVLYPGVSNPYTILIEVPSKDVAGGLIAVREYDIDQEGARHEDSPRYYLKLA